MKPTTQAASQPASQLAKPSQSVSKPAGQLAQLANPRQSSSQPVRATSQAAVSQQASQLASQAAQPAAKAKPVSHSQPASKPASQPAHQAKPKVKETYSKSRSSGHQVDGSPLVLSKDAVSASCILPGRAPIRKISEKNDAVEIFYLKSRLGIIIFQKHCIVKLWLELLNDLTQLTNEKIYWRRIFQDLLKLKKMRKNEKKKRIKRRNKERYISKPSSQALLYGSFDRKPG